MTNNEPTNIDELVDDLSDFKKALAFSRALKEFGLNHEFDGEKIAIEEELDDDELETLLYGDEFHELFSQELKKLAVDELLASLVSKGVLYTDGVDSKTGEIIYRVCEDADV